MREKEARVPVATGHGMGDGLADGQVTTRGGAAYGTFFFFSFSDFSDSSSL